MSKLPRLLFIYDRFTALRNIWNKFKHTRAANKNQIRPELEESEYLWGILKVTEAGTESSLQLVLQLWLLSFTLSRNQLDWSLIRDGLVGIVGIISNAETCGKKKSFDKASLPMLPQLLVDMPRAHGKGGE